MENTEYNEILNRIEYFRIQKHWSRYRLAKESGIPYSSFDNLFKRNSLPSISMLYKICEGIHISIGTFFQDKILISNSKDMLIETIGLLNEEQTEQLYLYVEYLCSQEN